MSKYRVTFGQKYRQEPHPQWELAHPDGWLTVEADNEIAARRATFEFLGSAWAFIYDQNRYEAWDWLSFYPLGELGRIKAIREASE